MTKVILHSCELASRANGPGLRAVVWMQGCTLACPGCFNPETHDPQAGSLIDSETLTQRILASASRLEGITISGGEPFQQPQALLGLLKQVSTTHLSRLVFSGYTLPEIQQLPLGPTILKFVDVLVAGRYAATQPHGRELLGSTNQKIHFLTDRYSPPDISKTPPRELILHTDGTITATGVAPWLPKGVEIRRRCVTKPSEHQEILLDKLGLHLPSRLKTFEM